MYEPKVLVAIPTYEGKDYIFKENFEAIKNLDYPNYDYIYLDNSKTMNYSEKLKSRGANCVRVKRGNNSRDALCNAQNYARYKVLNEGYDYLMFIESDLVPPKDIIRRLLSYNVPVVGALYLLEVKDGSSKIRLPCTFFLDMKKDGQMGTRIIHPREVNMWINTGLRMVHGIGLGCTIIRSDIVKRFPFWYDERFTDKHSDVYFYLDLQNKGIPVFQDTNIIIPHFPSDWNKVEDR